MSSIKTQFYSQTGEDVLLSQIFSEKENGCCLEIGALDGIKDSTTFYFENKGWRCVLIEANPKLAEKARINRRGPVFACAAGAHVGTVELMIVEGAEPLSTTISDNLPKYRNLGFHQIERVKVPMLRLNDMLEKSGIVQLDFATIDVEGAELDVLQGFDLARWKPRVLVLEDNSGGRDRRVRKYLYSKDYRCFLNDQLNDWYAHKDDSDLLTLPRRFAEGHRWIKVRLRPLAVALLPTAIKERLRRLLAGQNCAK
jgi:FkbM family methyltransferase